MKQIHKLVEEALQRWEDTRDSDRKLMLAVWYLQDPNYLDDFKNFFKNKAIGPESITRCRRKFQEEGKYLSSKAVEEQRFAKFNAMRDIKSSSVSFLDSVLN